MASDCSKQILYVDTLGLATRIDCKTLCPISLTKHAEKSNNQAVKLAVMTATFAVSPSAQQSFRS